jgi:hypothetical protein
MSAVVRAARCGWWLGCVALCCALLAACGEESGGAAAVAAADPWINPPREPDPKAVILPPFLVYRVDARVLDEALAELGEQDYVQLSPSLASHFVQQDVVVPMEMRPFLIRALDLDGAEITVVQSLQGLWARTIGGNGSPRRQPLVVMVDPTPVEIFVTVEAPAGIN